MGLQICGKQTMQLHCSNDISEKNEIRTITLIDKKWTRELYFVSEFTQFGGVEQF